MVPNFVSAPELFGPQEIWSLHENVQGHNVQLCGKIQILLYVENYTKASLPILPKNNFTQKLLIYPKITQ